MQRGAPAFVDALQQAQRAQADRLARQRVAEVLDEDGDESVILDYNETCGSSNVTTSLYVVRPGSDIEGEYVQGLVGGNMIEHVDVGLLGTYYSDIVEANLGVAMFHGRAAARIKGITDA